ncbi:hypothetical protein HII28_19615 [Planctomonas sp. JC2975]|uniref:hypothetical protein n=1 Tax=Planctomonas sp. JC2975 TaxID=2729626 RepID=UPI0014749247|nr:hypothetical protein [Planctomonas sp. JC2975]NNC14072.1 hypothetical protein [Planctomonas sp. JC2975]
MIWAILAVVGFASKGLLWLAIIGIILFVATLVIGIIRRAARTKQPFSNCPAHKPTPAWARTVAILREKVTMTAGEGIKKGAEGTKKVTDRVVDSVEKKINDVTDTVSHAMGSATDGIHHAASQDRTPKK